MNIQGVIILEKELKKKKKQTQQCFTLPSALRPSPARNCMLLPLLLFQPALDLWETGPQREARAGAGPGLPDSQGAGVQSLGGMLV